MGHGKWVITGILMISVVLTSETNMIDEQSNRYVYVDVNYDYGHNNSETSCEAPEKQANGGYKSDTDVNGNRYNAGDTIAYYCGRGYELIGQANRACNGTTKEWEPDEPYCQPEYIGHLMRRLKVIEDQMQRLNGIEDKIKVAEQRITTVENNTLSMGHNLSSRMSAVNNKVSAIYFMPSLLDWLEEEEEPQPEVSCISQTKANYEDTVSKCVKMQAWGVRRNGHDVSLYTWVIKDFMSKVQWLTSVNNYSRLFYKTFPGYTLRLRGHIYPNSNIYIYLNLMPGEYDHVMRWPFNKKHELTVMTNDGNEVLHRSYSADQLSCKFDKPTNGSYAECEGNLASNWRDIWRNQKHILKDGSVVVKLYIY